MIMTNATPVVTDDSAWLKGFQEIMPNAILCFEARPRSECKTVSAAVVIDKESHTTTVFVNFSLAWLEDRELVGIVPEMNVTEERPRLPQLIIEGTSIEQYNTVSEVRLILVESEFSANYISIPWSVDRLDMLTSTKRWVFWSLADQKADKDPFYFGYGQFESAEAFHTYANDLFKDA